MKAVTIAIRIADFLKEYPPFKFMKREDLIRLASGGRVKFHEEGEPVFIQGQPRDQYIYVIQQGRVRVIEELGTEQRLIDLRGPGDLLGLQGVSSEEPYVHTCCTESESILYALPRSQFTPLINASPEARRYLAAYFTLNPAYSWMDERQNLRHPNAPVTLRKGGLREIDPPQLIARKHLTTATPETHISVVARCLQSRRVDCVIIVDPEGRPLGKLTDADLRDRILEGGLRPESRAGDLMFTDLAAAHPQDSTAQLLLKLTRSGKSFLVVTEDGSLQTRTVGLVSERNLFLQYGRFPTVVGEAIASAPDVIALRVLRDRMEALILEFIEDRSALTWLMDMTGELNRKLFRRLIELVTKDMRLKGIPAPDLKFSWLVMGSGGRDELLIRSAVYHALVYEDPKDPEEETQSEAYFQMLAERVAACMVQCGFLESEQGILAQKPGWCLPLAKMQKRYQLFIREPLQQHVYNVRDAFDFQPLSQDCPLSAALRSTIRTAIHENAGFIRYMASDSLLNQPPRTIFQGYVVDGRGIQREELEIKFHALLPLVDVARVLALEEEDIETVSTWRRLMRAADRLEKDGLEKAAQLLREAAEAFQVAQFARVSQGLAAGTDGTVIRPSDLDAETRALLVTAFRAILQALEFTASRYELTLRI